MRSQPGAEPFPFRVLQRGGGFAFSEAAEVVAKSQRRAAFGIGLMTAASARLPFWGLTRSTASAAPRRQRAAARHVVLLGDSSFDNRAYVAGGPDIAAQLSQLLSDCRVTLAAVDGAVTGDVARQLDRAPADADHLFVSVGGNDALRNEHLLGEPVRSVAEALGLLAGVRLRFEQQYRTMLDRVLARGLATTVCTIYEPRFADPVRQRAAAVGLTAFNDVITRQAFTRGLWLIDLRVVCSGDEDFANPIEPSIRGGAKIAAAIADAIAARDFTPGRSEVFAGQADR